MWRTTVGLGLLGIAAWCGLLFGIGLDDLTNHRTTPGVVFSLVVLPIIILALLYGVLRVVRPRLTQRSNR
jgi:hypothetical protein